MQPILMHCAHANIRPVGSCSDRQFFCRIAAISSHSIIPAMNEGPSADPTDATGERVNGRGETGEEGKEADGRY